MMKAKPMQKVKTFLEKTPNALLCLLGAVVFLAGFYLLTSRTPLNKIWLPTTMNNDEVLYNRQVVSVITHGGPQGYFGYQEGTADIGRYGTWGPLLIWAYALPGFLFGSSVNVVLWCNLLFITLGIAAFARSAKLNWWQCCALRWFVCHCHAHPLLHQRRVGGHALYAGVSHRGQCCGAAPHR